MAEPVPSGDLPQTETLPPATAASGGTGYDIMAVRREGLATTDVSALLRKRLRFISVIGAVAMAVALALVYAVSAGPWYATALYWFVFAATTVLAGVFWKKASLSVNQLRMLELLLFRAYRCLLGGIAGALLPFLRP
ncbi:MAG TPA: hypothetical protein VFA18_08100 [Gemmataceae bacterium]|nr:hypothetical protein [Gemmataceae bacterium]